ncbi:hypothetical protein VC83_07275 [Pseudogymnoascus destructans]|uniref:Secreted protein n=1 Tax=Pseudogymnoascus destructans TaxID=655981 RepID=A0A177A5T2_9PEZI|nr:uncharacterized protein VC83_07275 [Pseudogymnoascus destructans]OAF56591.1 hypothetical protein VC83_07275 [Pseudogymnoascus destructans]
MLTGAVIFSILTGSAASSFRASPRPASLPIPPAASMAIEAAEASRVQPVTLRTYHNRWTISLASTWELKTWITCYKRRWKMSNWKRYVTEMSIYSIMADWMSYPLLPF